MNALTPDDERRFRDALVAHPEWRAIAEADVETAELLSSTIVAEAPPAGIRAALLAQIAVTPQAAADPQTAEEDVASTNSRPGEHPTTIVRAPRRWSRAVFALAACLAVLVGVGIGAVALNQQLNQPASIVALQEIQSAPDAEKATVELADGGTATAHWSASAGAAVLVTDGIPEAADGKSYELWFVRDETAVPAGVFSVEDGRATAALEGDMHAGDVIAVTVEQAGGSPTGTPTTDPFIVIPTA